MKQITNKRVEEYLQTPRRGPRYVYPWEVWLNGKEHLLTQGIDFDCSLRSFAVTVRRRSYEYGVRISVLRAGLTSQGAEQILIRPKGRRRNRQ